MLTAADGPLLITLAAVVRGGSFSAAAGELTLSKSVVSDRIRQLESRCGARLLERTTRRLRLTDAGAEVLAAATRVEDLLAGLSLSLDASRREPTGTLRVSTTADLGPSLVAPVVARFVAAHPKVRVDILSEDARRDLLDSKIDIAVRLGAHKDSSFVARKLAVLEEPIVCAPSLAGTLGPVTRPRDLAAAPWIRHSLVSRGPMRFQGPNGTHEDLAPDVRAESNSGATVLRLVLEGAGVACLPDHTLREHRRRGHLVRLCPGWIWQTLTLHALMPSRASLRPAVSVFLTMLQDQIALDRVRWGE